MTLTFCILYRTKRGEKETKNADELLYSVLIGKTRLKTFRKYNLRSDTEVTKMNKCVLGTKPC